MGQIDLSLQLLSDILERVHSIYQRVQETIEGDRPKASYLRIENLSKMISLFICINHTNNKSFDIIFLTIMEPGQKPTVPKRHPLAFPTKTEKVEPKVVKIVK